MATHAMSRLARMAAIATALPLSACGDSLGSYPFVGKWALENPKDPGNGLCGFIPRVSISRGHIVQPLQVLTINDIKSDNGRWVLNVTGSNGPAPPVVIKEVTAQFLVLSDLNGFLTCRMKKVGECRNLLCD